MQKLSKKYVEIVIVIIIINKFMLLIHLYLRSFIKKDYRLIEHQKVRLCVLVCVCVCVCQSWQFLFVFLNRKYLFL